MDWLKIQHYLGKTFYVCATFVIAIGFIRLFVVAPGAVNGVSMEPTYKDDQRFFINRFVYLLRPPRRFEVVDLIDPDSGKKMYIKRIVGLPGETLRIRLNAVYVTTTDGDELELKEPYLSVSAITREKFQQSTFYRIPDDQYFVMGDNRNFSHDSRDLGPIKRSFINGKVIGDR